MTSIYMWTDELLLSKEHVNGNVLPDERLSLRYSILFLALRCWVKVDLRIGRQAEVVGRPMVLLTKGCIYLLQFSSPPLKSQSTDNVNSVLAHKPTQESRNYIGYILFPPSKQLRIDHTREVKVVPL
jgi:hypothetical protein